MAYISQRRCSSDAIQVRADAITLRPPGDCATFWAMASGKKSAPLSSLADYGDDSEPDSDPEVEETGTRVNILLI